MPFVRYARDKRGYDLIYLVHTPPARRGKPGRSRLLYFFRTPPGVKVGREPFDESVRKAIEAQNPGVTFDWAALSKIPIPSPDVEYWRERRRQEREAKQARRAAEAEVDSDAPADTPGDDEAPEEGERGRRRRRRSRSDRPASVEAVSRPDAAAGEPGSDGPDRPNESAVEGRQADGPAEVVQETGSPGDTSEEQP